MEYDEDKAFPYPVLRPGFDDYKGVAFDSEVEISLIKKSVRIDTRYTLTSSDLVKQIEAGSARYVMSIVCRDTYYHDIVSSSEAHICKEYPAGCFIGEVCVSSLMVAVKPIKLENPAGLNEEFCGVASYTPGDILAQDVTKSWFFDRDVLRPLTSVFDLVRDDSLSNGEWLVGLESDRVQIKVSASMNQSICQARGDRKNAVVLINSLYFSAVIHLLQRLSAGDGAYEGKRWATIVNRKIHNEGWDLKSTDPYIMAQRLMKYPLEMLDSKVFKGVGQ